MKKSLKIGLLVCSSILILTSFSFYYVHQDQEKVIPLSGREQVFVMSFKKIENAPTTFSTNSFKFKSKDSITEGFQMLTFDFNTNKLTHDFLHETKKGDIVTEQFLLDISVVKNDGEFALYKIKDKTGYYNDIEEKYVIINLNDNENYPKLQFLWREGGKINGAYSVDTRDFLQQFQDSQENIFKN